ncbi:hypothetical protein JOB18_014751 [Solea senegalensis]|uniref:Ig-like domain-containing protein n=1 Tax=Solea senegalensis TaxID=28829 RepID=A0AAV6PI92_SOLSE|nr:hypothetical protein JOB18_014751 [Solea senegalensis]
MLSIRCVMLLLLLLLLVTVCAASEEEETVVVLYRQQTIPVSRGSSVKLLCHTKFSPRLCGKVHAAWQLNHTELTNPDRYSTTVNETDSGGGNRLRRVVTEILKVGTDDGGDYQCVAKCTTGESAKGHIIQIKVNH